jgi:Lar family restriction alleviation protein
MADRTETAKFPQPQRKDGESPCGECHIRPGETCDICGAVNGDLMPCPFCGGRALLRSGAWAGPKRPPKFGVECLSCTMQSGTFDTSDDAAGAWNRRAL